MTNALLVAAAADAHHQGFGIVLVEERQVDVRVAQELVDRVGGLLQHLELLEIGGDDPPDPHEEQELFSGAGVG